MEPYTLKLLQDRWKPEWNTCIDIAAGRAWKSTEKAFKKAGIEHYIPVDVEIYKAKPLTCELTDWGFSTNFVDFIEPVVQVEPNLYGRDGEIRKHIRERTIVHASRPCGLIEPILHILRQYKTTCILRLCRCIKLFGLQNYDLKLQVLLDIVKGHKWKVELEYDNSYHEDILIINS